MVDEKKILLHNAEMAEHANGAAQYLGALLGGMYVTMKLTRDMVDFLFAGTKKNIVSCPFSTQEGKDAETRRRKFLMGMLKTQMGL